jgi:hypothetical protein
MSQLCGTPKCERTARALCDCCKQNLCLQHLCEHNASLVSQLNPLTDEINAIGNRLNQLHLHEATSDCREQLERWRQECHEKIDRFFKQKCQELDRLVAAKLDKQREEIVCIKTNLSKFIHEEEVTRQDIDTLTSAIRHLKKEVNNTEQTRFRIDTRSLVLNDTLIQFSQIFEHEFDPSVFSTIYKTIVYPARSYCALASNDRLLLTHQEPNLCFLDTELRIVKQILWSYDMIHKTCWSSTLAKFIILTEEDIFLLDENTISVDKVSIAVKQPWISCTCFNDQLFLSTNVWGSSILEIKLSPSISVIKEWKSPITCTMDEHIDDIVYSNGSLALVIENKVEKSLRIELRSSKTLDRLWSLLLDGVYDANIAFRCCSIDYHGWLVADHSIRRLLHVTTDGKMKQTIPYEAIPYCITLLGSNILVIATQSVINFHKI